MGFGKTNQVTGLAQGPSTRIEEIMKKSVITPGFEKLDAIPPYEESKRQLLKKRRVIVTCIFLLSLVPKEYS